MLSNTYGDIAIRTLKERVVSGFNISRTVILISKIGIAMEERRCSKMQNLRHYVIKTRIKRRIGTIIGSDSTSHFKTPQTHGNDSEARKLAAVRVGAERC